MSKKEKHNIIKRNTCTKNSIRFIERKTCTKNSITFIKRKPEHSFFFQIELFNLKVNVAIANNHKALLIFFTQNEFETLCLSCNSLLNHNKHITNLKYTDKISIMCLIHTCRTNSN